MRNPERIKPFLEILEKEWNKVPDWRFGQLIENIKRYIGTNDLFYMEDDELEKFIIAFFKQK